MASPHPWLQKGTSIENPRKLKWIAAGRVIWTGFAAASTASAFFGFTFDRSSERGLFAACTRLLRQCARLKPPVPGKPRYQEDELREQDPAQRVAIFWGMPLVLLPWLMPIVFIVFSWFDGKYSDSTMGPGVTQFAQACFAGAAASLVYSYFTRDLCWVRPENAEALRRQHALLIESLAARRRELVEGRAMPAAPVRPASQLWLAGLRILPRLLRDDSDAGRRAWSASYG